MSKLVAWRLERLELYALTTQEDRILIDREVERETGLPCDEGVGKLSDWEFKAIVNQVLKRKRGEAVPAI